MTEKVFDAEYASYYQLFYQNKNYGEEASYITRLIFEHRGKPASSLLDLGCGAGDHDVFFSRLGYKVLGIDRSADMIAQASLHKSDSLEFQVADIQSFDLGRKFDAVVSLFHVMSYQQNKEALLKCFINARKHLNEHGVFIFDFWHGGGTLSDPPAVRVKHAENDKVFVTRISQPTVDIYNATVTVDFTLFVQNKLSATGECITFSEAHVLRYWFVWEINELLRQAGFTNITIQEWMSPNPIKLQTWYGCAIAS
jgi:SAM-dependent methyltransferase